MDTEPTPDLILSPQERRSRNREEMMTAILQAARAVMRERGVSSLSLREVARRVHLQSPSLYAYFPSKAVLYDALFVMGIRLYSTYRHRYVPDGGDFWERLTAWCMTYMRFAREHPDLYQLVFERPVPSFVPSDDSMAESRRLLAGLEEFLQDAVDEGVIDPRVPLPQARDLMIVMMQGMTSQHVANEPDRPAGSGRYGSLIPEAVAIFRAAWEPGQPSADRRDRRSHTRKEAGNSRST